MTIKTDSKGFLIADGPIDTASLSHGIDAVHNDTSAILSLLRGGQRAGLMKRQRVSNPPAVTANVERAATAAASSAARSALAQARSRDARGRFLAGAPGELTGITKAVNSMTRQQGSDKVAEKRAVTTLAAHAAATAADQARDHRGRFAGRGGSARGGTDDGGGSNSLFRNLLSRLKDHSPRLSAPDLGDFEKIDPNVEAAKEVSKLVGGPLATVGKLTKSGASRAFGIGKDATLPWFRKIFTVLKESHDDQSEFALAQGRTLKEIDKKTGEGTRGGGGIFGGIADMFKGGIGGLLRGGGGLLSTLLGGALKFGKFGLKRMPLLGALFAGGSALASIFGGDDPNKTAAQNREDRFTGAGSGIGALIGGGIGLLGGPVGAMIGGIVGDKVGEIVGGWLATVDWSKVGAQISGTWDSAVGTLKDDWKAVTDKLSSISKTVGDAWDSILSGAKAFLKNKFGIDTDAIIKKASDIVKPAVDAAKGAGTAAVDYVKDRAAKMAHPYVTAAKNAVSAGQGVLEDVIPGYRHKSGFDGLKGGSSLSKYGSYTNEEANTIRQLKTSGANTSASLKGGMPREIQEKIIAQAQAAGLDPRMMLEFAAMESGGNANAISSTGAIGIYQETGKTASALGVKNRFDVDQNIAGGMKLARDNSAILAKAGLPVNPENLYMMHQLGPTAAKEVIKGAANGLSISDLSASTKKAVALNYGAGSKTAADYLSKNSTALDARVDSVVGKSDAGYLPGAVTVASASAASPVPTIPVAAVPAAPVAPPAPTANIPVPLTIDKPVEVRVTDDRAVGQDLRNRRLAQIATGGVSS